jgi:hypothetical protein
MIIISTSMGLIDFPAMPAIFRGSHAKSFLELAREMTFIRQAGLNTDLLDSQKGYPE